MNRLLSKTEYVIREAMARFKNPATLWSTGKDSTTLLYIFKLMYGKVPIPVIHIDTGFKFKEIYEFRDRIAKEWDLNLIIAKNPEAKALPSEDRFKCCTERKTRALQKCIAEHGFDAIFVSIRWDEHGIRGKERYFSPRTRDFRWIMDNQPVEVWDLYQTEFPDCDHVRVHPLLHWSELDIWKFIKEHNIPVNPLYFSKNGKRYRSLGCMPCTVPVDSLAKNVDEIIEEIKVSKVAERDGRSQDKEQAYMMERLRALGYM